MNSRTLAHSLCAMVVATAYASLAAAATPEADLILDHGAIHTPSGVVSAIAIKNGVIIAIGDEAAVDAHKGQKTRVMDLHGDAVLPGLHDMHVHPMGAGLAKLACNFPQGSSPAVVRAAVQRCAAKHAPGEWITGGQWDSCALSSPNSQISSGATSSVELTLTAYC